MALSSLRLRRTLTGLSTLHRSLSATSSTIPFPYSTSFPLPHGPTSAQYPASPQHSWTLLQSRTFRLSSLSSARLAPYGNNEEIGPDTILFEGCDYMHWLIVMDFPKDNKPPPEEMVRTYEETCARGLNISVEEAKQKMYACSTTTYTGFQAVMSEEESEKFQGLPGVVFVLPDSYIDPKNKEYGGDKYINGTIIPRPPPVQYGRQGGRYNDRNRNPNQARFDRQGPMSNQQGPMSNQQGPVSNQHGNPPYGQQWQPVQGGGEAYGPGTASGNRQSYPRSGGDPNQTRYNRQGPMSNQQGPMSNQQAPMSNQHGNPPYGQQWQPMQGGGEAYGPGTASGNEQSYPRKGGDQRFSQGEQRNMHGEQSNYAPMGQGGGYNDRNRNPNQARYDPQEPMSNQQGPMSNQQGPASNQHGNPPYGQQWQPMQGGGEAYGSGPAFGNGQSYPGNGGDQRFSQGEQRNVHGEQTNYAPMGQTGIDQGRY